MKTSTIPSAAKRVPLRPLALGEKTGHHHSLYAEPGVILADVAEMYEMPAVEGDAAGPQFFLRVTDEGVSLQHQEHKTHAVPPGDYKITIQTEVTDWGRAKVID